MSDLRSLYQEVILDHNRQPRNFGPLAAANRRAEGNNPLCGDQVTVYLDLADGTLRDLAFEGSGCAISTASASLMTEALKGRTVAEAREIFQAFHRLVTGAPAAAEGPELGKLAVFDGVREYPMRVKCATLPWHTFKAALEDVEQPATTE
jgi:nitrogen fixation protein NifU and related proteins